MRSGILRVAALALPLAGLLAADTLVMNDGTRYTGTFVAGNRSRIRFRTDTNGRQMFDRKDVRFIRFGQGDDRGMYGSSDRERNSGAINDYSRNTRDRGYASGYRDQSWTDMDRAYQTMGSALGNMTSDVRNLSDNRGKVRQYQNGYVYWTSDTGAHAVSGPILRAWERAGAERSRLGYPISDESDATRNGYSRVQQFEHGNIYVERDGDTRIEYTR